MIRKGIIRWSELSKDNPTFTIQGAGDFPATVEKRTNQSFDGADKRASMNIYESLRNNLEARYFKESIKTIAFLSSNDTESNASVISVNYARTLAKKPNSRVLLIDGNLRRPRLHREFTSSHGINSLISNGESEIPLPIRVKEDNLFLLHSFGNISDPLAFLNSPRFDDFLKGSRDKFDFVIIDAPSVLESPESLVICSKSDGVVLIIDSTKTQQKTAISIKNLLNDTGSRLLGVILDKKKYHIPAFINKYL
jgi:protein-tyrosine kinase